MPGPVITPLGATPGTVVASGALVTPGGDRGPAGVAGPAGPQQVSTQAGNRATLGSDSLIYVPPYPYADATQGGLMRQLSGNVTDYQGGDNSCHPLTSIPPASTTIPGLLKVLSGNVTDYVGGDNACHPSPQYIEYGDLIPPASPSNWDDEFTGPLNTTTKWTLSGAITGRTIQQQAPSYLQMAIGFGTGSVITALQAKQTISSTTVFMWQTKVRFIFNPFWVTGAGNQAVARCGLSLNVGTTLGIQIVLNISTYVTSFDASGEQFLFTGCYVNSGATFGTQRSSQALVLTGVDVRLRIGIQNPNLLVCQLSNDGYNWSTVYSEAFSNGGSLNGGYPNSLTLFHDNNSTTPLSAAAKSASFAAFDYVRMIS